jgi:predicted Zn-dependent peptidase
MIRRSQLPNGIRVVSERLVSVPSVTLGIWVENGSRFERPHQGGLSHFLEHLLFKGTDRRTAAQIAEEIDAVGGVLNAFTGKEYTCYYARVLAEHTDLAADVLADLFLHSRFDPDEIERERTVVLQEISQVEDTPDDYIHDLFNLNYWPGHPLSLPVCGNNDTVRSFQRQDFLDFLQHRYRPDRLIIAAAGNLTHERLLDWVMREFTDLAGTAAAVDGVPPAEQTGLFTCAKPLEQVHLCLGTTGVSQTAPERYAAHLLNTALGGGMSSRLFQEVRERRGLAYSVYSFLSAYRDAGYLGVYVGTSAESVREVIDVVLRELWAVVRGGLQPAELTRVKNQLKGSMLLGLETSDARMSRLAKNEIFFGRDIPLEEIAASIDATTSDEVVALAGRLIRQDSLALAVLGDLKGQQIDASALSAS